MEAGLDRLRAPLEAMMRWFGAAGVRGAIIGGVAASLLGKPRLTKDIDAVVLDADAESLLGSGARFGFVARIADAVDFAHNTRMLLLCYPEGNIDIDLSLGALPFENELIERSSMIDVGGGVSIRVASPEDIVISPAQVQPAENFAPCDNAARASSR